MKFSLTEEQAELVCQLNDRQNCKLLEKSYKGATLGDFQNITLAFAAIVKKCLISLDTGLGKTYVATGLINMITRMESKKGIWIMVVQCSNLATTFKKVQEGLWGLKAMYTSANTAEVLRSFRNKDWLEYDLIIVSYEAVANKEVSSWLYDNRTDFIGIIIDESHMIGNGTSATYLILRAMAQFFSYAYLLTATPIRVNPAQIAFQVFMICPEMFETTVKKYMKQFEIRDSDRKIIGWQDLEYLKQDLSCRYIGATRKDLGLKGEHRIRLMLVETNGKYKGVKKMETFSVIKGEIGGPAMVMFMQLVLDKMARGEKGIAYVNLNANKDALADYLFEAGIHVGILDGSHTNTDEKKNIVHQAFLKGEYDILLTNITTGKDLQCNYVCFYELTFDFQQFLGRGERGLKGNDLDIIFFIADETEEVSYFYQNMLQYALMLEEISSKDVEDIKEAYRLLGGSNVET